MGSASGLPLRRAGVGLGRAGRTATEAGHQLRMVVFGSTLDDEPNGGEFTFIPLGHIVEFLQDHPREYWDLVRHVQTKEPVLGFLLTLEKALRGGSNVMPSSPGGA